MVLLHGIHHSYLDVWQRRKRRAKSRRSSSVNLVTIRYDQYAASAFVPTFRFELWDFGSVSISSDINGDALVPSPEAGWSSLSEDGLELEALESGEGDGALGILTAWILRKGSSEFADIHNGRLSLRS
jgi:hypothetical protein